MSGVSCNKELAADSVRGFAVKAFSGRFTWGLNIESLGIGRCSNISGTFHGTVKVAADLVYSHNEDHFLGPWAIQETRLELPSIFIKIPSSVRAFALERKTSAL